MELLAVSNCLLWLLDVSHCLSGPMKLLHVSNCLVMVAGSLSLSLPVPLSYFMLFTVIYCCRLSLTVYPVPWSCSIPLTVFYGCWLSLSISSVRWSCYMSSTVSYGCWLSLTVSLSSMEVQHISHCLLCVLALSHGFFWSHGVAAYLSLSAIIAGCVSLPLSVQKSCCKFLTVSWGCWLCLFQWHVVVASLSLSLIVAGSFSLSLLMPRNFWLFLTVSHCLSLSLSVSLFLAFLTISLCPIE